MFRYFKKINKDNNESTLPSASNLRTTTTTCLPHSARSTAQNIAPPVSTSPIESSMENSANEDILGSLPSDPGLRPPIFDYDPNIRDQVRRAYLQRGPCQPKKHAYPTSILGGKSRKFCNSWFNDHPSWLEYSVANDAVYCLCCYLSRPSSGDSFIGKGFRNWRKKSRLHDHIGKRNSAHNIALKNCMALLNQKQHIESVICKQSEEAKRECRKRLRASINCARFLLRQGLPFRGHYEDEESHNRGNFIELLQWLADNNEEIRAVVLENAPGNQKLIAPDIQKDITKCFSSEILSQIVKEIGDGPFSILLDESKDVSSKEQLAIVLRYVHKGQVIERFLGIEHVTSTTAISLKATVDDFFSRHGLSISRLRGQGYDGASNMKGEYNGLKAPILKDNDCAYYVHCFAHQLQLAVVAVAKKHTYVEHLYVIMSNLVNVVAGSAKRQDMLRSKKADAVFEALSSGEIVSGRGLNQESTLKREGDTRWGSHHNTIVSLINIFSSVVTLLEDLAVDSDKKFEAKVLLDSMQNFNFVFSLHLMKTIMGITDDLSKALQRKDQDIVNAMKLVTVCKERLHLMRDEDWDSMLSEVSSFCTKHRIKIPDMSDVFQREGRPRRNVEEVTNSYHYRVEYFNTVIDMQLLELNNRFNETNTELLLCVACLSPIDSFSAFDKDKLIRFARFYPRDFSPTQLVLLEDQLLNYIADVQSSNDFLDLKGIADLAVKMVEKKKDVVYPLVYLLITLALLLPVATATVERVFSAMKIVKNRLRNRMGDEWMNDILICYIERFIFDQIGNATIMNRFQKMRTHRGQT